MLWMSNPLGPEKGYSKLTFLMTVQLKKSAFLCYIATQVSLVWICFRANQTDPNHYLHYISAVRLSLCA